MKNPLCHTLKSTITLSHSLICNIKNSTSVSLKVKRSGLEGLFSADPSSDLWISD